MTEQINYNNPFVILFLAGTIGTYIIRQVLKTINWYNRKMNGQTIPQTLAARPEAACFDTEKLKNINEYENAKFYYSLPTAFLTLALKITLVCTGFYPPDECGVK